MTSLIKISYIFTKKQGRRYTRLKIRIGRRTYCVGQRVLDLGWIHSISTDGTVEFTSEPYALRPTTVISNIPVKGEQ